MKRLLALILTAALALSLVACGGGTGYNDPPTTSSGSNGDTTSTDTPSGGEESENPGDTSTDEDNQLVVGETYSTSLFDITITGFDFSDKAENPNGDNHLRPRDGYVTANLYYTIKYTGKAKASDTMFAPSALHYGDGYVFDRTEYWFYVEALDGWLNISDGIQPLTPEFPCKACFFVPEEVETEKGVPLSIDFSNHNPDEPFFYSPRPKSEDAQETTYLYCTELLQSDTWADRATARGLMLELGEYKDSAMTARLQLFTYDDREYFKEYVQNMEPMSADAIQAVLSDAAFSMRNNYGGDGDGTHTITFQADGTVNSLYTYQGEERSMYESWRMENGSVVCTQAGKSGPVDRYFTPYQFDETRYLLIDTEDDYSMVLTQQ